MQQPDHDILIIGGGINGCGIARDAAGRGLRVLLAEMNDLASATSAWSTKLIHGGLRYLEHREFRLVRESLHEREVLWSMAPHLIHPMRFVLPHHAGLRPAWLLRAGLFLYDRLGGRQALPGTRALDLARDPAGQVLRTTFRRGFEYSDCTVDDARLVIANARDAAARGARIAPRTRVVAARPDGAHWRITLTDSDSGAQTTTTAQVLVNAAGPWVDRVQDAALGRPVRPIRLVQGSHIVVRRQWSERAFIFQNADGRIVFTIPWASGHSLIGTTDLDHRGDPASARITPAEIDYILAAVAEYLRDPPRRDDIVWSFAGVRPLYDDGSTAAQKATRDYLIEAEGAPGAPGLVKIFGGKLTTYRRLAEDATNRACALLGRSAPGWTAGAALPGGDFPMAGFAALAAGLAADYPFLPEVVIARLARAHGTEARAILGPARSAADLGHHFGAGLYAAEVDHMRTREWAHTAEDILWRRSKLGLDLAPEGAEALARYLEEAAPA
jgi:glycerol-3-phosphate dehydrogenase